MLEAEYSIPFYLNPLFIIWISLFFNHFRPQLVKLYTKVNNFYNYICEHNPLIIDYEEKCYTGVTEEQEEKPMNEKPLPVFEDKYLEKFKKFPNEFQPFTDDELANEENIFNGLYNNYVLFRNRSIKDYNTDLVEIDKIVNSIYKDDTKTDYNENGLKLLFTYYGLTNEWENKELDEDEINLYIELIFNKKQDVLKHLEELRDESILDKKREAYVLEARRRTINKRLSKFINNYVLEMTPLGNVYMRYNVDKESFEYFSNSTIPYRYLEPIGRKYVMTYWCKPIFVDLEEELKISEEKYNSLKNEKEKEIQVITNNKKSINAQFKSYNQVKTNKKISDILVPKERGPQIKANLPDVSNKSEKMLLKEHANRYTWEGRLGDFCPLKKIDKKVVDKNLNLSWAEYKKLQQENKNK